MSDVEGKAKFVLECADGSALFGGRDVSRRPKRRRAAAVQTGQADIWARGAARGREGDQYSMFNIQYPMFNIQCPRDGEEYGVYGQVRAFREPRHVAAAQAASCRRSPISNVQLRISNIEGEGEEGGEGLFRLVGGGGMGHLFAA